MDIKFKAKFKIKKESYSVLIHILCLGLHQETILLASSNLVSGSNVGSPCGSVGQFGGWNHFFKSRNLIRYLSLLKELCMVPFLLSILKPFWPNNISVIHHSILAFLGNDIIKANMIFVIHHSSFKRDKTGRAMFL